MWKQEESDSGGSSEAGDTAAPDSVEWRAVCPWSGGVTLAIPNYFEFVLGEFTDSY